MESKINRLECIPECGIILPAVKDIPWIVSLFTNGINMSNFIFRCLGNIVSSYSILVEKQCIDTDDVMRYSIVIGEHKVAFNDYDASPYRVRFIESIYKSRHNALLSIADPFIFSPLVRPICIPPIRQWYALSSNSTAYTYEKLIKINYLINIEDDIRQEINLVQQHNRLNIRDM
ncbi:uncharacterized protein LOC108115081 [Drosophila eugracilis]|uniref:uncharacterized protein LOC108115081 n=1 Tax=Drosophila eugracilis TaxID=29029 RepID=UPI0007E7709B|nr:uncharacterized protein LOC108115081 [Drosophila eugracilis]